MRLILSALLSLWALCAYAVNPIALPKESPAPLDRYADAKESKRRIAELGPHRIEGIWQFPNTGATIAIERAGDRSKLPGATTYNMVVVRSENRTIPPGTIMGKIIPSAKSDVFDAMIYSSAARKARLTAAKHFTLTLGESGSRLVFKRVKAKYSFNFWRMLPYMFRYAVRRNDNTGEAPLGCVKLFPEPEVPAEPRYL